MRNAIIGRNVWIGANVSLVPGSTIGDGAIIGMGSVISGTIPPLAIVGSPVPRILGYRDDHHYQAKDDAQLYGGVGGHLLK